jgi:hypothetical protein
VLLEHYLASELGEGMETLDLVRIGTDGSPHWSRVWPTPEDNPRHAGLELWMAAYGHQIVSRPVSEFDFLGQLERHVVAGQHGGVTLGFSSDDYRLPAALGGDRCLALLRRRHARDPAAYRSSSA